MSSTSDPPPHPTSPSFRFDSGAPLHDHGNDDSSSNSSSNEPHQKKKKKRPPKRKDNSNNNTRKRRKWTADEEQLLRTGVEKHSQHPPHSLESRRKWVLIKREFFSDSDRSAADIRLKWAQLEQYRQRDLEQQHSDVEPGASRSSCEESAAKNCAEHCRKAVEQEGYDCDLVCEWCTLKKIRCWDGKERYGICDDDIPLRFFFFCLLLFFLSFLSLPTDVTRLVTFLLLVSEGYTFRTVIPSERL